MSVTQQEIEQGLRSIGLEEGDIVVVHSSLSSFGHVEGGAEIVVDALLDVIGKYGTLIVPTHTYNADPFDAKTTPSVCGAITEAVRNRPNAVRSQHPTHSMAAIGRYAEELTDCHEYAHAFGEGSPLYNVLERNGKILLIGVTHVSNSMIHVAEELANVPYLDRLRPVNILQPNGKVARKIIRRPGCSRGFNEVDEYLKEKRLIWETQIGESTVKLMWSTAVVATAVELLKEDPAALLCTIGDCASCAEAHGMINATQVQMDDELMTQELEEMESYTDENGTEFNLMDMSQYDFESNN